MKTFSLRSLEVTNDAVDESAHSLINLTVGETENLSASSQFNVTSNEVEFVG